MAQTRPAATIKEKLGGRWRSGSLAPEKSLRTKHSRTSENAILEHERTLLSLLIFVLWRKTNPLSWEQNASFLRWPIILVSYACSPTLETKSHSSTPKEWVNVRMCTGIYTRHDSVMHHCPPLSVDGCYKATPPEIYAPAFSTKMRCYDQKFHSYRWFWRLKRFLTIL